MSYGMMFRAFEKITNVIKMVYQAIVLKTMFAPSFPSSVDRESTLFNRFWMPD